MDFLTSLLGIRHKTEGLFDQTKGKTLEEYKQELLVKMGKRQFEKLENLGLSIPVRLG